MKKIILKTTFFVSPFVLLFILTSLFYNSKRGDLLRVGYIIDPNKNASITIFEKEFNRKLNFKPISNNYSGTKDSCTVLTIGDSFSEQQALGYQSYLADFDGVKVLHFDKFLNDNVIETINALLKADFFDSIKTKYILLQSVERKIVQKSLEYDSTKIFTNIDLNRKIFLHNAETSTNLANKKQDIFFSRDVLCFPYSNLIRKFNPTEKISKVFNMETTHNLFTTTKNELLFSEEDYDCIETNNNETNVNKLNLVLNKLSNKLSSKGIKLIVLIAPDKFDFYYDDILKKSKFIKPIFFDLMQKQNKEYAIINSKEILIEAKKTEKDIYHYDDTHWSPIAAKLIAKEIKKIIVTP